MSFGYLASAEGELLAAVYALSKSKNSVGLDEFELIIELIVDSKDLTALQTTKNLAGNLARWSFLLQELRFKLAKRAGVTPSHADGPSRSRQQDAPEEEYAINLKNIGILEALADQTTDFTYFPDESI